MKKLLYIFLIFLGILSIIVCLYFFFNIYFVVSSKDGVLYDGFGYPFVNGNPSDPKTIWAYLFFFLGCALIDEPRKKLIEMRDNKKEN